MLPPSRAPAALSQPPASGDLNYTRRQSVIPDKDGTEKRWTRFEPR